MVDVLVTTATTNFDKTVTALVRATIEENLRKATVWLQVGSYETGHLIPGTNLIRHIAYGDLTVTTGTVVPGTPPWLTEGVPPSAEALAIGYAEYGANQAGRLVGLSDISLAESPHALFAIAAERVGFNAVATLDQQVAETISAGTSVSYASTAVSRVTVTAAMPLNGLEVRKMVARLKALNIPTFPDGTYHAILSPQASFDIMNATATGGWLDANKYAQPSLFQNGEIGRFFGVTFYESNVGTYLGALGAAGAKVYSTVFFGPRFFAFGDLQSVQAYMVRPGGDHADPLAQKAYVGWKAMWGTKLLALAEAGGAHYIRLEHGGSL